MRHNLSFNEEVKTYFEEINESYLNNESGYIVGTLSLDNIKKVNEVKNEQVSVVLIETIPNTEKVSSHAELELEALN